jgi:MFS family permease
MVCARAARAGSVASMSEANRLVLLCASRVGFALVLTAYASVLPVVREEWGMSAGEAGLIQSAWHVGYLLSLFGAGIVSDRIGPRRTFLAMSWAACASAGLLAWLAADFASCLALHFLAGACSGGSYTPVLSLIAERFPQRRRGAAMGWYLAAASFGYAVALLASAVLTPLTGWRGVFVLAAAGTFAGALLGWMAVRGLDTAGAARPGGRLADSAARLWRNRPAQLAIWSYTFHAWELLGMWAWLPAFIVASLAASSGEPIAATLSLGMLIAGLTHLVSVAGSVTGGVLADRVGRTPVILAMSCASLACSLSFGWLFGSALWLVAVVAVLYNFSAIADSSVFSTVLTETVPADYIGFAFSIRSVLGFGMGALAPWLFGLVLDSAGASGDEWLAWGAAWSALGAVALAGPFLTLKLHAGSPAPRT